MLVGSFLLLFAVVMLSANAEEKQSTQFSEESSATQPAEAEPNTTPEPDSVAVTVNGVNIMQSQINAEIEPQLQRVSSRTLSAFCASGVAITGPIWPARAG